jgi:hypothetical protein
MEIKKLQLMSAKRWQVRHIATTLPNVGLREVAFYNFIVGFF